MRARQANFFAGGKAVARRRAVSAQRARGEQVEEDERDIEEDLARLAIHEIPELLRVFGGEEQGAI